MKELKKFKWRDKDFEVLVEDNEEYFFLAEQIIECFGLIKYNTYTRNNKFIGFKLTDLMAIAIEKAMEGVEEKSNLAQDILDFVSAAKKEGYNSATIERLYFACRICVVWQEERINEVNKIKAEEVYLIECTDNQTMKIGYSNNLNSRFQNLQSSSINKLNLLSSIKGKKDLEKKLHNEFKHLKIKGEWFEWSQNIIDRFKELSILN